MKKIVKEKLNYGQKIKIKYQKIYKNLFTMANSLFIISY